MKIERAPFLMFLSLAACGGAGRQTGDDLSTVDAPLDGGVHDAQAGDQAPPIAHGLDLAGADLAGLNGWTIEGQPVVDITTHLSSVVMPLTIHPHPTEARRLLFEVNTLDQPTNPLAVEWTDGTCGPGFFYATAAPVPNTSAAYSPTGTPYVFYSDANTAVGYVAQLQAQAWSSTVIGSNFAPVGPLSFADYPLTYVVSAAAPLRIFGYNDANLFDLTSLGTSSAWTKTPLATVFGKSGYGVAAGAGATFYIGSGTTLKSCTLAGTVTCGAAAAGIATGDNIWKIVVSPSAVSTVYLLTGGPSSATKLYKSTDSGAHFSLVTIDASIAGKTLREVLVNPASDTELAVLALDSPGSDAYSSSLWLSKDGGASFTRPALPATEILPGLVQAAAIDAAGTVFIFTDSMYSQAL